MFLEDELSDLDDTLLWKLQDITMYSVTYDCLS